jgi:cytoskeleton-associated protein 5
MQRPSALPLRAADEEYERETHVEEVYQQPDPKNGGRTAAAAYPPMDRLLEQDSELDMDDMTVVISSILSNDPARSVDALKQIQKVLELGPDAGPSSLAYRDLAEHTEGLVETITLQMGHVFDRPEDITLPENFRLAKHLIQTLNAFCDHPLLAESLTVEVLTSLLEELTLRLLETDNSVDTKVKDLSKFINMIILRWFATARRMSVFRYALDLYSPCEHCTEK